MDEHEMRAFELEMILLKTERTSRLVPAYRQAMVNSIRNHRELSITYRPYEGAIDGSRSRNTA